MLRHITTFSDGTSIEFDRGRFDAWCVYHRTPGAGRRPPLDLEYFDELAKLARTHGTARVYGHFVEVYEATGSDVQDEVLEGIVAMATEYGDGAHRFHVTMATIYAAMVAEERRGLPLGKRVKRLGIHQVLCEAMPARDAANYSRGKRARDLMQVCRSKGF